MVIGVADVQRVLMDVGASATKSRLSLLSEPLPAE
jgi:hypothetical protein